MAKTFDVPVYYRSPIISVVKEAKRILDPRKKDLSPSVLDFGPVRFKLARHFGFCYGVENAIEIAYRAIEENPDRRIFLLSEMIHNPHVNADLQSRGVEFLREPDGTQRIPFSVLTSDDVVIVPAFGTTREIEKELERLGVDKYTYDATCPFVEKVWKKSDQIGTRGYTVVVHGKRYHEETRATVSRAKKSAPVVVLRDIEEARMLADIILERRPRSDFRTVFAERHSVGFDPEFDLDHIGVVNQTTMLATETKAIAQLLKDAMIERFGAEDVDERFADTSDTLCYATYENQNATRALIEDPSHLAIVVGGYNSSNTSHLVELCEEKMPTYYIHSASEMASPDLITHFNLHEKAVVKTAGWLPTASDTPVDIILTAGASCPDALLDEVVKKIISWFPGSRSIDEVVADFNSAVETNPPE